MRTPVKFLLIGVAIFCLRSAGVNAVGHKEPISQSGRIAHDVSYSIPACLQGELISRLTSTADLTPSALAAVLEGYNFGAAWGADGQLSRLFVSETGADGRTLCNPAKGEAASGGTSRPPDLHQVLLQYEPLPIHLPERYSHQSEGFAMPVTVPIDEFRQLELGDSVELSLPTGGFHAFLENRFEHDNGDVTWVARMEEAASNDTAIITGGTNGVVGQIVTSDTVYSIEFEEGRSWLVEVGKPDPGAAIAAAE